MNIIKYFIIGLITIIKFPFLFLKFFLIGLITILSIFPYYIITGIKFIFKKKNNKNEQEIEKKFIPIITITLSILTYLICIFILTRWYVQNERTKNFTKDLTTTTQENTNLPSTTTDEYKDLTATIPPEENYQNNNTINTNYINVNLNYPWL